MGLADKAKNTVEDVAGKAKEAAGKTTGNDEMKREGKKDQTKASAKDTKENVKDTLS